MRVVIGPDKFKGSLSAMQAAEAIARGFRRSRPEWECQLVPMADGGEGTVDAFLASGAQRCSVRVRGPLGDPVEAIYARNGDLAVIEMSAASGLALLPKERYDPLHATTYGTGELLTSAAAAGARRCIVGIGGSATVDAGTGMLRALGVRFLDASGSEIDHGMPDYERLASIDVRGFNNRVTEMKIAVASDVDNPLTGEHGAARVFGPQKGASTRDVEMLDRVITHIADVAAATLGKDLRDMPGAGAAGGLGFALAAFLHARIERGALLVGKARGLDEALRGAGLCATGEGSIDAQTLEGKTVEGVAEMAKAAGVKLVAFGGRVEPETAKALAARGVETVEISTGLALDVALRRAAELLEQHAATWASLQS